jgi:hypothetical protein
MDEIVRDNIRSVSVIYFAAQLEQMRLFDTVDRIVEQFMNGLLPIGAGPAGKALDRYYWSGRDRMTAADRRKLYTRILGEPGGDAQPNSEFVDLWMRFVGAVAEFSRQQTVDELMEAIRKSGRDLAVNVSTHGYGYTYFAARTLNQDIASAFAILKPPEIQKAYGASSPYQVIERVASLELGAAIDITRYRTRAETGKRIVDILASNSANWMREPRQPLFRSAKDRNDLIQSVEQWLAVTGVPDDGG